MFLFGKKSSKLNPKETEMDTFLSPFQVYINELLQLAAALGNSLQNHAFTAPEVGIPVTHNGDTYYGSKISVKQAFTATHQRIETLKKMNQGKVITDEEHQLLMKMPVFAQDCSIENYDKIAVVETASLNRPGRCN